MDELIYEAKRAHWGFSTTAMARLRLESHTRRELLRMTPVRFDVLFVMLQRAEAQGVRAGEEIAISLGEIIIKLGFNKSTVARTVRHMEEVGFVRRERDTVDRRQTIVIMTARGLRAAQTVLELLRTRPHFVVERVREWLRRIGETAEGAHAVFAAKLQTLARLFGQWSYPIYTVGFDPLAVYPTRWANPPPFVTGPLLPAVRSSISRRGSATLRTRCTPSGT